MTHRRLFVFYLLLVLHAGCGSNPNPKTPSADKSAGTPSRASKTAPQHNKEVTESPVFVDLPEGWIPRTSKIKTVVQAAEFPGLDAHFTLALQPRSLYENDLLAFAVATRHATRDKTKLSDRSETDLEERDMGHHHVVSYVIDGATGTYAGRSRVVVLQMGDWFCKLFFWTSLENWDAAQPKFEELVERIQLRSAAKPAN